MPLIVVAGPPNVGKSSLVRALSSAEPEVAEYPFTTKNISLGHFKVDGYTVQIMDTPGLLDRPMDERNEIERQAILALKLVANIVIYLFDPSPFRYYPIENQLRILEDIKRNFMGLHIIKVINKIDIADEELRVEEVLGGEDIIKISVVTGEGIDRLMDRIREEVLRLVS
jgi:nucleolar GTP-binding protein